MADEAREAAWGEFHEANADPFYPTGLPEGAVFRGGFAAGLAEGIRLAKAAVAVVVIDPDHASQLGATRALMALDVLQVEL